MADLIIDASLASAWCFPDERTDYTNGVLQAISSSIEAFAPRLWAYEVRNSVLMGLRRGRISRADAEGFLDSLADRAHQNEQESSCDAKIRERDRGGGLVGQPGWARLRERQVRRGAIKGNQGCAIEAGCQAE
jgi:hypothetical protein